MKQFMFLLLIGLLFVSIMVVSASDSDDDDNDSDSDSAVDVPNPAIQQLESQLEAEIEKDLNAYREAQYQKQVAAAAAASKVPLHGLTSHFSFDVAAHHGDNVGMVDEAKPIASSNLGQLWNVRPSGASSAMCYSASSSGAPFAALFSGDEATNNLNHPRGAAVAASGAVYSVWEPNNENYPVLAELVDGRAVQQCWLVQDTGAGVTATDFSMPSNTGLHAVDTTFDNVGNLLVLLWDPVAAEYHVASVAMDPEEIVYGTVGPSRPICELQAYKGGVVTFTQDAQTQANLADLLNDFNNFEAAIFNSPFAPGALFNLFGELYVALPAGDGVDTFHIVCDPFDCANTAKKMANTPTDKTVVLSCNEWSSSQSMDNGLLTCAVLHYDGSHAHTELQTFQYVAGAFTTPTPSCPTVNSLVAIFN